MISTLDVYLYGMTVLSTIHRLERDYPDSDSYGEIKETYVVPGGETGNSAIVLSKMGLNTKIDGPFLGMKTKDAISDFCRANSIDCSGLNYDPDFEGVQDLVIVDSCTRTVFGRFGHFFSGDKKWSQPDEKAIKNARIISIDPFFGEESEKVAQLSIAAGRRYITIDCSPDSFLHRHAAATVVSNEFIRNNYPDINQEELMMRYINNTKGLVVFTFGAREILFARQHDFIKTITPYKVNVKSTLGAGDTFRAGILFGILNQWEDEKIVRFAAATAASVCKLFPMALDPPCLEEILSLANSETK